MNNALSISYPRKKRVEEEADQNLLVNLNSVIKKANCAWNYNIQISNKMSTLKFEVISSYSMHFFFAFYKYSFFYFLYSSICSDILW